MRREFCASARGRLAAALIGALLAGLLPLLGQGPEEAEARQILLDSLQAHGGADAAALARRVILSGTVRSRVAGGGFAERRFRIHSGGRGAFRAEISGEGFERIYISDGELARISQDGRRKGLLHSETANKLFAFFPLTGVFAALAGNELRPERVISRQGGALVEAVYLDSQSRIPRSRPLERRYRVRIDPQSRLVASMTLFSSRNQPLVPDEAEEVYEYSDYRDVEGVPVPFLVQVRTADGLLLSEYALQGLEFAETEPDLSLP